MDIEVYEFYSQLFRPYITGIFIPEQVDNDLLYKALGNKEYDCQLAAFYVLDDLLEYLIQEQRIKNVFQFFEEIPQDFKNDRFDSAFKLYLSGTPLINNELRSELKVFGNTTPTYDPNGWIPTNKQLEEENILLLHGTWPSDGWWLPSSYFAKYIDGINWGHVYKQKDQFQWTGRDIHYERIIAGDSLAEWLEKHPYVDTIIAHSHGGNVTIIASRIQQEKNYEIKIKRLVLLGTPIRTDYTPELRKIGYLRNIYSFFDLTQILGTKFSKRGEGRTLSDSEKSLNVITSGGPVIVGHSDLHEPWVWQHYNLDKLF